MHTYVVSVQYQAISCKHRHNETIYVTAPSEEDAVSYARNLSCPKDYELRRVNIIKEIVIHTVMC